MMQKRTSSLTFETKAFALADKTVNPKGWRSFKEWFLQ